VIRKINEEFCPCRLACQLGSDTGRGFEMDGKEGVIEGSGGEGRMQDSDAGERQGKVG